MKTTKIDLPKDIEIIIPENERNPLIQNIIHEARTGEFTDFQGEKYVTPKIQCVQMLTNCGDDRLLPIANAVRNGEYDED